MASVLSLGGQTIEFKGPGPKAINLVDHIGNNGVLALQLNTQGQVCASAISVEYKNPPSGADFDKLSQYIAGSGLKALGDVPVAVTIDNVDGGKITFDMSLENRKATNVNVSLSFGDDRTRNMALDPSDLAKIKSVISQINDVHFGSFANAKIEWSGNKFDGLFDLADGLFIGTTSAKSNGLVMVDLHMVDGRVKGLIETSFQGTVNRVYEEQGKLMTQINVAGSTLTYSFQHQGDTIQSGTFGLEMINASSSLMDRLIGAGIDKLSTDELDRTLSTNGLGHANVEVHTLYNGNISAGHLAQTTSQTIHILGRDSLNRQLLIDASDNGATLLGGSWSSDNVDYQILGSTMIVTPKAQQGIVTLDETQLSGLGLSGVVIDATQIKGNINLSQDLLKANNISVVLSGGQDTLTLDGLESSQVKFGIDGDKLVLTEDATQHQVRISGVNGSVLTDKALITFADKSVSLRDITTGIGQLHDNPDGVHSYSLAFLSEKKSTQSAFHEKAIAGVDMSTMSAAQQHQLLVQAMGEMGAPGSADDTHIGIEPATNQSNPLAMTH
ncbi:hypothetical protein [Aeromonas dhakensis]|uniref:hypothetical protein n=1 Tax=Aeromonas dhakensis TaxID=196024 RepID=UPI002440FEB3|nr:hypothetical protein [Aeromonas dhakensis]